MGEKSQNNKREHEDDNESSESETEASSQVCSACKLSIFFMCFRLTCADLCEWFVKNIEPFFTNQGNRFVLITNQRWLRFHPSGQSPF